MRGRGGSRGGGGGGRGGSRKGDKAPMRIKVSTSKREDVEIKALNARIAAESPAVGDAEATATDFAQLPISRYTCTGLEKGKFRKMTQIQRIALPHALAGRDVLGAAKTGSGKTLAFVIPILERLYRLKWSSDDGLGALIISPTRELALQIFEVVRVAGQAHFGLSAGVVCGGKDFAEEQGGITGLALLVATPGRLLQHLEQTPGFDCGNLSVLVLDEADRLLDMGFQDAINSIISYLPPPPQRQTMLFSATQTKSVKDLARLSLSKPQYLGVHESAETATPARLTQTYVVCKLQDKLNLLYSFIRSHLKHKTIVFVSSCKESRFLFEVFRRLRPGIPLQLLHGKMKQQRRMLVYYDFLKKPSCVLFATDVAARGLDFPAVDWVLQLDCPEDVATYIHRVGRTARFKSKGHGLLAVTPGEAAAMVPNLQGAKIPISQIHINPSAAVSITGKVAAEVAADADLKSLAQRAFTSYVRSIYLQPNKAVFDVAALPLDEFAESLGLAVPPKVHISKKALSMDNAELRAAAHSKKNENKALVRLKEQIAKGKAEKAAKRAASTATAAGGAGESRKGRPSDSYSDSSDDDDDDDDDDSEEDEDESISWSGGSSGSSGSSGSGSDSDSDDSESEGEEGPFLVSRARARGGAGVGSDSDSDSSDVDLTVPEAAIRGLSSIERSKLLAITRDTQLLGAGGAHRGSDGLTPFQRIAQAKGADVTAGGSGGKKARAPVADLPGAVGAFAAKVAARLAATAGADREHERQRVRGKHREQRLRRKGRFDDSGDEEEEEDESEFAPKRGGGGGDDDEEEDGSDSDGSEAPPPEPVAKTMTTVSKSHSAATAAPAPSSSGVKRSRDAGADSHAAAAAVESKSSSKTAAAVPAKRARTDKDAVAAAAPSHANMEDAALKLMGKRSFT